MEPAVPNRLAQSTSPYLLQHKDNPVDWYPWCDEAFARAKNEDKPIFLSIGYSACHWCHVMEHESFENQAIADYLNANFICIKVDREERPDIDQVYMNAVQMLTGSGGWPMSVFLKPDGQPFYGGTYWPPEGRFGKPGFPQVLAAIVDAWKTKRVQLDQQGELVTGHLKEACLGPKSNETQIKPEWLQAADTVLMRAMDREHGGFGSAPKFPHATDLTLLLELESSRPNAERRSGLELTLGKMARGGIFDHLGGGFARYSVDSRWLVPHFEKMLYDNASLSATYADAFRCWGQSDHADVVRRTLDYVLTQMTDPQGGFYSSEDADSEGEEGKFYVWTVSEIQKVLGAERAELFCAVYDVSEQGNFEGHNILNLRKPIAEYAQALRMDVEGLTNQLAEDRNQLLAHRNTRIRPGLDDKVLLSWNGLMVIGLIKGYRAVDEDRYRDAAKGCIEFVFRNMRQKDGKLWHTWRKGQASVPAYLDDYAIWLDALTEYLQVDPQPDLMLWAVEIGETLLRDFADPEGGFFYTTGHHEALIARSKDIADSSLPSGNAMAASGLLTLSRLLDRNDFRIASDRTLIASGAILAASPQAAGQSLRVLHRTLSPNIQWFLIGGEQPADLQRARRLLMSRYRPEATVLICNDEAVRQQLEAVCPLVQNRPAQQGQVTLYACTDMVCKSPLVGVAAIEDYLKAEGR